MAIKNVDISYVTGEPIGDPVAFDVAEDGFEGESETLQKRRAKSIYASSQPEDYEILEQQVLNGEYDPTKNMMDQINPPASPFEGLSDDPQQQALRLARDSILKSTDPRLKYLQDIIRPEDADLSVLFSIQRTVENYEIWENMIAKEMDSLDPSTAQYITDWFEWHFLRWGWIGSFEAMGGKSENLTVEFLEAATSMSPEDFKEFATTRMAAMKQEGFFTPNNIIGLAESREFIDRQGVSLEADQEAATAYTDLLLFGATSGVVKSLSKGAIAALKSIPSAALRSGSPIRRLLTGAPNSQRATEVIEKTVADGVVDPPVANATHPSAITPGTVSTPPVQGRWAKVYAENRYVQRLQKFFTRLDSEEIIQWARTFALHEFNASVGARVLKADVVPNARNIDMMSVVIDTGKSDISSGTLFKNKGIATVAANKIKAKMPDADVKVLGDSKDGYFVRTTRDIKDSELPSGYTPVPPKEGFWNILDRAVRQFVGSSAAMGHRDFANMFGLREGQAARYLRDLENELPKVQKATSKAEAAEVDRAVKDMLNGPGAADSQDWWTRTELEARMNVPLTDTGWKYYETIRDLSDAAGFFQASMTLKKFVEAGFIKIISKKLGTKTAAARRVKALGKSSDGTYPNVLNLQTGKMLSRADIESGKVNIYRLNEPMTSRGKNLSYVANPDDTGLLEFDDVFGYQRGPARINPTGRHFAVSIQDGGIPRAFMLAASKTEVNDIVNTVNDFANLYKQGNLTDDIVARRSAWNTNINTVQDFLKFAEDFGIASVRTLKNGTKKYTFRKIVAKARGESVATSESFTGVDETMQQLFYTSGRGDVLQEYGGELATQLNPIDAISKQMSSSVHRIAFNQQTIKAKNLFVEQIFKMIDDGVGGITKPEGANKWDVDRWVNETDITGSSPLHTEIKLMQRSIWNRASMTSDFERKWMAKVDQFAEYIYDKSNGKMFKKMLLNGTGWQRYVLGWNFHSTLGMFNFEQILVQGFSAVVATALSPRYGVAAIASQPLFWTLVHAPNASYRKSIAKVLETLSIGTTRKIDADTWEFAADYMRKSGRNIIEMTSQELGVPAALGWGTRGAWQTVKEGTKKGLHWGSAPFRYGEKFARSTSIIIAAAERAAKTGKAPKLDNVADELWVSGREQGLTLHMNTGSHSAIQRGITRMPLQFMSYMMRVFEAMLTGGRMGLSGAERRRLGALILFGTGLGQFGFDKWSMDATEALGGEPGDDIYRTIQGGFIDGLLAAVDVDVSYSDRVAILNGLTDMYDSFAEADGLEFAGKAALGATFNMFGQDAVDLLMLPVYGIRGEPEIMNQQFLETIRTIKGVDNIAIARGIIEHGWYKTKTGRVYPLKESGAGAMALTYLGLKPYEYLELLKSQERRYDRTTDMKELTKEYKNLWRKAYTALAEGDVEGHDRLLSEYFTRLNLEEGITISERDSLRRLAAKPPEDTRDVRLREIIEKAIPGGLREIQRLENSRE